MKANINKLQRCRLKQYQKGRKIARIEAETGYPGYDVMKGFSNSLVTMYHYTDSLKEAVRQCLTWVNGPQPITCNHQVLSNGGYNPTREEVLQKCYEQCQAILAENTEKSRQG